MNSPTAVSTLLNAKLGQLLRSIMISWTILSDPFNLGFEWTFEPRDWRRTKTCLQELNTLWVCRVYKLGGGRLCIIKPFVFHLLTLKTPWLQLHFVLSESISMSYGSALFDEASAKVQKQFVLEFVASTIEGMTKYTP